ncbi:ly6/PLAUR domain-containing protein 5-like [Alligator mississippiensis]|uniref:Ly6/PLAUR domain-containing protein 5-like n=1 Tax=Alligator mississippiensis TaxID=8496 RepID=A0A151P5P8_ALLMI|nr:ly6/PLAUR domain-containing protein 5-like [Alligator mississippiensis]
MLPFISSKLHACDSDLCNEQFFNHSLHLNVPPEAPANATDALQCYSCLGLSPESSSGENMDVVQCPSDFPRCAIGTASATIDGNCTASSFYRSCQDRNSIRTHSSHNWESSTRAVTTTCHESLCNDGPHESLTPPPLSPHPSLGDWHPEGA